MTVLLPMGEYERERERKARLARMGMGKTTVPVVAKQPSGVVRVLRLRPRWQPEKPALPIATSRPAAVLEGFDTPTPEPWRKVLLDVCKKHRIKLVELLGERRSRYLLPARYEAMWRMSRELGMSTVAIGRRLNRDHSSVINALRRFRA